MRLRRRSMRRDERGHATTETLIMVPVLAVVWAAVVFTHHRYGAAVSMAAETRRDLWVHAYEGCRRDAAGDGETALSVGRSSSDGFIGAVNLLFGSGAIPGFRIDEVDASRDVTVERPGGLGGGSVAFGHSLVTSCNEVAQRDRGFIDVAWGMFFP